MHEFGVRQLKCGRKAIKRFESVMNTINTDVRPINNKSSIPPTETLVILDKVGREKSQK
jgi:hypothetical protein